MTHYITRISHFTFSKDGDELVVTSERDDSFEARYDWPDSWSEEDDLTEEIHKDYYISVQSKYRNT